MDERQMHSDWAIHALKDSYARIHDETQAKIAEYQRSQERPVIKTREEALSHAEEIASRYIRNDLDAYYHDETYYNRALCDLIDFIYGEAASGGHLAPPACSHNWVLLEDSHGWGCARCSAFLPDKRI